MGNERAIVKKRYSRRDIISHLENSLREQMLPRDTKIASALVLAQRYNVSLSTMNRVLDKLEARKILYRVRGSGTFTSHATGGEHSLRIGIVMPRMRNLSKDPFGAVAFSAFHTELLEELQRLGHEGVISFHTQRGDLAQLPNLMGMDALIMAAGFATENNIALLRKLKLPTVLTNAGHSEEAEFSQVCFDYRPGFRKLLEHLHDSGFHSFLVTGLAGEAFQDRSRALIAAARQLGISENAFEIHTESAVSDENIYYLNLERGRPIGDFIRNNSGRFDAVISLSDYATCGIVRQLREYDWEPGEDYAIASYDNFEGQGILLFGAKPLLTAVSHPLHAMATEAARLVVMEALTPSDVIHIVRIPARELVIRDSTCFTKTILQRRQA